MNRRILEISNYATLTIIAVLLLIIGLRAVSPDKMRYILYFAIFLLILRVGFRLFFYLQEKRIK